jgi:predicted Rdx family selenoprotein
MKIVKSSRHQKIIGNLGEDLLCNWLSRSGFEVTVVDHTGIDVVAYNPDTGQRFGVTVKSRTRKKGTETSSVNIFSYQKGKNDRQKVLDACKAFACEPWIAIYVESSESADLLMLSLKHYDQEYRGKSNRAVDDWKMGEKYRKRYEIDPNVRHIHMAFSGRSWTWA